MKYGVNLMVWTTHIGKQDDSLLSRIREWGFDGVELFLSAEEPADITSVKRMLDRLGLERTSCSVLPREAHLVSAEPDVRARGVDFLKRCVERTAELDARLLCGPLYAGLGVMTGSRRTKEEWIRAIEGLQAVARRAEQLGVTLCLEPLNRFETYFLNTLNDAAKLIHEIGARNIRIHFDTFHGNIEEKKPATRTKSRITSTLFNCPPCLPHAHLSFELCDVRISPEQPL